MDKDECFKMSIELLLKLALGNTDYIATIKNAEFNKDYKTIVDYLYKMRDGIDCLIDKLEK